MNILTRKNPFCLNNKVGHVLSQILFYASFLVYMAARAACETSLRYDVKGMTKQMLVVMWICALVALFNVVFLCPYSIRQMIAIFLLLAFWIHVYNQSGQQEYRVPQALMIVFSCRCVKWDHLKKVALAAWSLVIITIITLNHQGILSTVMAYRGEKIRYTLGFSHPNVFGVYILCFVVLWVMIRYEKMKIFDFALVLIMSAIAWFVPNSKTATFSLIILFFVLIIFKLWGDKFLKVKFVQGLCLSAFPVMALFSFLASYYYDAANPTYAAIDLKLFTTRLSLAHAFFETYPITLFGQKLKLVGSIVASMKGVQAYILDNFYMRVLMNDGILSLILFLIILVGLVYVAIRNEDYGLLAVLLVLSVYSVYEFYPSKMPYNMCLFQIVYGFFKPLEEPVKRRRRRRKKDRQVEIQNDVKLELLD